MGGPRNKRYLLPIASLLLTAAVFVTPRNELKITWRPETIEISAFQGGSRELKVQFGSTAGISNANVFVSAALRGYIRAELSDSSIPGGDENTLKIFISVPRGVPEGTVDGTIHIRTGNRTIAKPLPVILHIVSPQVVEQNIANLLIQEFGTTTPELPAGTTFLRVPITPEIATELNAVSNLPAVFRLHSVVFDFNLSIDVGVTNSVGGILPLLVGEGIRTQDLIGILPTHRWHREDSQRPLIPDFATAITFFPYITLYDRDGNGVPDTLFVTTSDTTHTVMRPDDSDEIIAQNFIGALGITDAALTAFHEMMHVLNFRSECGGSGWHDLQAQEDFVSGPFERLIVDIFANPAKPTEALNADVESAIEEFPNASACLENLDLTRPEGVTLNVPTDVSISTVSLSWSQSAARDFASYKIFRDTNPGADTNDTPVATITDSNQTSFTDTNLTPNTKFFYKVFVFDKANLSAESNEVSAQTMPLAGLADTPWPMVRHDARHSGRSSLEGIISPRLKWFLDLPGGELVISEFSISKERTLYGVTSGSKLLAVNPNGTFKWQVQLGVPSISGPFATPALMADGAVIIGTDKVYAVDSEGSIRWVFESPGNEFSGSSPAIGPDGTIYIASTDFSSAELFALAPEGTLRWKQSIGFFSGDSPAVGPDGTIYIRARRSSSALDAQMIAIGPNGTLLWTFLMPGGETMPSIGPGGTIYVAAYDNFLYAISPGGLLKWKQQVSAVYQSVFSDLSIDEDGNIYIGAHDDKKVVSFDPSGGIRWSRPVGFPVDCIGAIDKDGALYIGTNSGGGIFSLSQDGSVRWRFVLPDSPFDVLGCPVLDNANTVYVTTNLPTRLYAITNQ